MGLMEEVLFEKKSVKEGGRQQREDKVYPRPGINCTMGLSCLETRGPAFCTTWSAIIGVGCPRVRDGGYNPPEEVALVSKGSFAEKGVAVKGASTLQEQGQGCACLGEGVWMGCQQNLPQCHRGSNAFRRLRGGSSWNEGRVQTLQLPQVSLIW